MHGRDEKCIQNFLGGKPEGKRPLRRRKLRWEDNIRVDIRKLEWEGVDWMHLAQIRTSGGPCKDGNEPSVSMKGAEFLD
jgi:hypothetical protein